MKKPRKSIVVEINRELYGTFTTFQAAWDTLKKEGFELNSYKYEIRKLAKALSVKLLAVKRGRLFYTVTFVKCPVNTPISTTKI